MSNKKNPPTDYSIVPSIFQEPDEIELWKGFKISKAKLEEKYKNYSFSALFFDVRNFIKKYSYLTNENYYTAVAIWIFTTYFREQVDYATRLLITAPTKASGKSVLLKLCEKLVFNPLSSASATSPALYRKTEPFTLLLDEADTVFNSAKDKTGNNEDMRAYINAGFEKGNPAIRCVGNSHKSVEFNTFNFIALCGIDKGNQYPDTIKDRSIHIKLYKKSIYAKLKRMRTRNIKEESIKLSHLIKIFYELNKDKLYSNRGDEIKDLEKITTDRQFDKWEASLYIAKILGEKIYKDVLKAIESIEKEYNEDTENDYYTKLFILCLQVLENIKEEYITPSTLLEKIIQTGEEGEDYTSLSSRGFGKKLGNYGLKSEQKTINNKTQRIYKVSEIQKKLKSYIPTNSGDDSMRKKFNVITSPHLKNKRMRFNFKQKPQRLKKNVNKNLSNIAICNKVELPF